MHYPYFPPIWKKAPFIRLLLPLVTGIISEWYWQVPVQAILIAGAGFIIAYLLFFLFAAWWRFRLRYLPGLLLNGLLLCLGLLVTCQKDIRNNGQWYGRYYQEGDLLTVRLNEPLMEKPKSFKANGFVESIIRNNKVIPCKGKILLYFSKGINEVQAKQVSSQLKYGDKILISKAPRRIRNAGNPGSFNYERYAAFQQVFHNIFLNEKDWIKTGKTEPVQIKEFIFTAREYILFTLRKGIAGKDELAIAEALLIGYTNDLDKDLVQAYSNTGVVHIIAISGMHLGLIYLLLAGLFKKIPLLNRSALLQVALILGCLWLFSLLTGASASVTRAAVMFTFITIGSNFKKQSSIYNSLAGAAFVMLCYNPYFLWDVGFQLSYLAVISILVFQKPVYNCWYQKNKWAAMVWKLAAISLSAQILTFPVCIYYFHQFPNFFLLTNMVAVPLSSIILYAEIGLIAFSWIPLVHSIMGKIVTWLVWMMNKAILLVNGIPFAVWAGIPSTVLSTLLLYAVVIGLSAWLLHRNHSMFTGAIFCIFLLALLHAFTGWQIKSQQKLIVYNIPQHRAIDLINGNDFIFIGDSVLQQDRMLQNFTMQPARIQLHLNQQKEVLNNLYQDKPFYQFWGKRILVIDRPLLFEESSPKITIDFIIISKNPVIRIAELASVFNCGLYIFDASNSLWKIDKWQKECEELHLRSYSVPGNGAFVSDTRE